MRTSADRRLKELGIKLPAARIYTNRNVTDEVGPHNDLLDEFPYLGPPHGFTPKGMKENL
jgi:hypothetical protein